MAARAAAALLMLGGLASASEDSATARPAPGTLRDHDVFTGSYICLQGSTGLALHVDEWPAGRFKFFPTPVSPHNCSGEFKVRGEWSSDTRTLSFRPSSSHPWIHNDCDYVTVSIHGHLSDNGMRFSGEIAEEVSSDCSSFSLFKGGASSSACFDSDNGAVDFSGGTCADYRAGAVGVVHRCGFEDDADFTAERLCCACGGGARGGMATSACFDWDSRARDSNGATCTWYRAHPDECGSHDAIGFRAADLCCKCGGGVHAIGTGMRQELDQLQDVRAELADLRRTIGGLKLDVSAMNASSKTAEAEARHWQLEVTELRREGREIDLRLAATEAEKRRTLDNLTLAQAEAGRLRSSIRAIRAHHAKLRSSYAQACHFLVVTALLLGLGLVAGVVAWACAQTAGGAARARDARDIGEDVSDLNKSRQAMPLREVTSESEDGGGDTATEPLL